MTFGKIAVLSLFGLGAAVVVLPLSSGCGTDVGANYYCDGAGCYTCDGFGCSAVPTPTKPTCRNNAACGPNAICTTIGCSQKCAADSVCRTAQEAKPECRDSAQCGQGKICVDNQCR